MQSIHLFAICVTRSAPYCYVFTPCHLCKVRSIPFQNRFLVPVYGPPASILGALFVNGTLVVGITLAVFIAVVPLAVEEKLHKDGKVQRKCPRAPRLPRELLCDLEVHHSNALNLYRSSLRTGYALIFRIKAASVLSRFFFDFLNNDSIVPLAFLLALRMLPLRPSLERLVTSSANSSSLPSTNLDATHWHGAYGL